MPFRRAAGAPVTGMLRIPVLVVKNVFNITCYVTQTNKVCSESGASLVALRRAPREAFLKTPGFRINFVCLSNVTCNVEHIFYNQKCSIGAPRFERKRVRSRRVGH